MRKKRVLIAHNSMNFINKVDAFFQQNGLYSLSNYALDGEELLNKVNLDNYDIVIVKNALSRVTGLYALQSLLMNSKLHPEQVILITPFINEFFINKCSDLGISYINDLDIEVQKIPELLLKLELEKNCLEKLYFDPQIEIIKLLKQIGLLRTYIGYTYLEYVLNIMLEKSENIYKTMNEIYEKIACHFNVTAVSVEKAMRTCIKSSLLINNNFYSRMLFGYNVEKKDFPSTSIFLQVCVKTLKEQKNIIINNNMQKSLRKI